MNRYFIQSALLIAFLEAGLPAPLSEPLSGELRVDPQEIELGTFYSGAVVEISGEAAPGSDIVIVIRGPEIEESFNKKVRAGPIWISSGKVHISGAPTLFLSYRTAPVRSILDDSAVERYDLDLDAIRSHMHVDAEGDPVDVQVMRENYIDLKRNVDIYATHESGIEFDKTAGGPFHLSIVWPRRAPPAEYEVTAYELHDNTIIKKSDATLRLVKVGLPAQLARFSTEKAEQYGLLAVLIAASAGFGINFLVSRLVGVKRTVGH